MKKLLLILGILMLNSNIALAANNLISADWWKTATLDKVKAEIANGADVNAKNDGGGTALMLAAGINKNSEIIKILIKAGADVNAKNDGGGTALMLAASINKNSEITKILIKAGADVNAKANDGMTALTAACANNSNIKVIKELIESGADIDVITTNNGVRFTALSTAFVQANSEIWKYLAKLKVKEFCELTNSNSGEVYLCEDKVNLYLKKEEKLQSCARNMMAFPYITRLGKVLPTAEDPNKTVMSMIGLAIEFNCSISGYNQSLQ